MNYDIIDLKLDTFAPVVMDSSQTVLVDFYADWCVPCQLLVPVMEELYEDHYKELRFARINVDECGEIANAFDVHNIPTVILFRSGQEVGRLVGVSPKETYEELLR